MSLPVLRRDSHSRDSMRVFHYHHTHTNTHTYISHPPGHPHNEAEWEGSSTFFGGGFVLLCRGGRKAGRERSRFEGLNVGKVGRGQRGHCPRRRSLPGKRPGEKKGTTRRSPRPLCEQRGVQPRMTDVLPHCSFISLSVALPLSLYFSVSHFLPFPIPLLILHPRSSLSHHSFKPMHTRTSTLSWFRAPQHNKHTYQKKKHSSPSPRTGRPIAGV